MAVFFLLIGLEVERELYAGELSDIRNALLPICPALGGMIIPALLHLSINIGTASQSGIGIPMATDIAFALGVLSLHGNRVPSSLKVFLTALAIIDDLGAVVIIALFYTQDFSLFYFGISLIIFVILVTLNRLKVSNLMFYLLPGIVMWYCMLKSGVHATTSGILLVFAIPFSKDENLCMSHRLQHFLHRPVAYLILPVFALANTGIVFGPGWYATFAERNTVGILAGLVLGKPLGIFLFSLLAVKTGLSNLPEDLTLRHFIGA
jgi:Na+:H+ antiporter, NhaA family